MKTNAFKLIHERYIDSYLVPLPGQNHFCLSVVYASNHGNRSVDFEWRGPNIWPLVVLNGIIRRGDLNVPLKETGDSTHLSRYQYREFSDTAASIDYYCR